MWLDIFWLVLGLVLILYGANLLTDGASAVAKRLGVSDLIIGLTVVAMGTSTPELVISIMAAVDGNASLAVGNVVGSNIFNILMILGITALIMPIKIKKSVMSNEIPMVVLSSLIMVVMGYSAMLDNTSESIITRTEGIFLLVFFLLFMRYMFASARRNKPTETKDPQAADGERLRQMSAFKAIIFIIAGLAGLIWGGDKFVDGATGIARLMGVSDAVIGLTIVAIGTSLPELATSVVAAIKKENGLAIGNVIGSNIFNVLLILGTAATISPLPFGGVTHLDLWVLMGASVLFWICGWFFDRHVINRAEGLLMLICYGAYMTYLVIAA